MSENEFFETSFRFKWGTGFVIEFLSETLQWLNENKGELNEPLVLRYILEGEEYVYNTESHLFDEVEENEGLVALRKWSSPTNFVLKMASRQQFDALVTIGNQQLTSFKAQLINEFQEENDRSEQLHKIYDDMDNFDALLTYTNLAICWQEDIFIIEDPEPKKIQEGQHFIG